jgi:di/tricarboxylate transporter
VKLRPAPIIAALLLAAIGLLATVVVAEYVTVLLFFSAALLGGVAPVEVVFSGFHSGAFWLVFGGLVIGIGVHESGLAPRLARVVARRLSGSYPLAVAGVVAIAVLFSLFVPSTMGRLLVLMPIVLALAEGLGFKPGSNGYIGLALALPYATMLPGFAILPATVPGIILAGAGETLYGITINYASYLWLHFPVLGLLKAIVIWGAVVLMFPDRVTDRAETPPLPGMSRDERLMALLLVLALALWMTDYLHGIAPAWVALAIATVTVLPVAGLVSLAAFNERMNLGTLLYIAGTLGIGAMIAHSDLDDFLAALALDYLPFRPGEAVGALLLIAALGTLLGVLATQPAIPLIMSPLAADMARVTDLPVETVLMAQVVGFSTVVLPYQTPPLVVGMALAGISARDGIKFCLATFAVTVLVLIPLDILWWKLIGWLP